jgi:hypothetical protein
MSRRISIAVLASLAALAAMAAIGSASASAATVLCKTRTNPCPAGEVLPAGTQYAFGYGFGEPLTLKVGGTTRLECSGVNLDTQTTAESGTPLPANGYNMLWNCGGEPHSSCRSVSASQTTNSVQFLANFTSTITLGSSSSPMVFTYECAVPGSNPPYYLSCSFRATKGVEIVTTSWAGEVPTGKFSKESAEFTLAEGSALLCGGKTAVLSGNLLLGTENAYIEQI